MIPPEIRAHQDWLGYIQPVGLVVSPAALAADQCYVNLGREAIELQEALKALVEPGPPAFIPDLPAFTREFLGWDRQDLAGAPDAPELPRELDVSLSEYSEILAPTYAVPDPESDGGWQALILALARGVDMDAVEPERHTDRHWHASPQARVERLLRENEVPIGILWNETHLRLVYAPRGESSGHLTFPVQAMTEVAGRPLVAALHMLLGADRLFALPAKQRLPAVLDDSRKYQNLVSTRLAEQVLAALHELLAGFRAADAASQGELLRDVLERRPQDVYGGMLGTLLRLVFTLYAEDRELLPVNDPVYQQHYSVTGLYERLRDEHARHPDTMDQRFGAWAQLLTLFRLIHDGAAHGSFRLPARHGRLFDPDTWDFLEGRPFEDHLDRRRRIQPPRVPDGVVYRVLENLLILDGDRISYRALDVEQIGSVYEAMMGFELRIAESPSLGVRPDDVVVDLQTLVAAKPGERLKALKDQAALKLPTQAQAALKAAKTPQDIVVALGRRVSRFTPNVLPKGAMFLQPTDERRRSGSHYTPRSLTEPIVATTLRPLIENLGPKPTATQILDLKICDPAMGSGAFLVEAGRFLGKAVTAAWEVHGERPTVPPDEDIELYAMRLVAQRCLYGVDKNPYAVDLAKLSLWLATLARDHPFTFLDHALRHGDSLVGLSREQIESFGWEPKQRHRVSSVVAANLKHAEKVRAELHALGDSDDVAAKTRLYDDSRLATQVARDAGDLVVAAFFGADKSKARDERLRRFGDMFERALEVEEDPSHLDGEIRPLYEGPHPVVPFHWPVEFPEVFSRHNGGFDAFVGNPPFLGGKRISTVHGDAYADWLVDTHEHANKNADLIAHFYRRAFELLRERGTFGLIATNTIAQGDTRASGLRWICTHGGTIYVARKRVRWPAGAAVVVSVVHVGKRAQPTPFLLDGREVDRITAFLFHDGGHDDPARLRSNAGKSFIGSFLNGMGFTFDDSNEDATPLEEMRRLIASNPANGDRILPYIGGEEVNDSPTHAHHRYAINFGGMTEDQARQWPDLMSILEDKVKPARVKKSAAVSRAPWWLHWRARAELYEAISALDRVLVISRVTEHPGFVFLRSGTVFADRLVVFAVATHGFFACLQSRVHEGWARFFSATLEDRLMYAPSDCFETFPFPEAWEEADDLAATGEQYHEFRAAMMVRNDEGLTKTYNRFHDPDERDPETVKLRELHDAMDRAVLDAYGWTDIQPTCDFFLDYEDEEDDEAAPTRRKKPWRYRWPDETRDEVLARLLKLNAERAKQEALEGAQAPTGKRPRHRAGSAPRRGQGAIDFGGQSHGR